MSSNERTNFEAYVLTERGEAYLTRDGDDYEDYFVQEAWEAWQARAQENTGTKTILDAAKELVDAYYARYATESGEAHGPLDIPVESLKRAILREMHTEIKSGRT